MTFSISTLLLAGGCVLPAVLARSSTISTSPPYSPTNAPTFQLSSDPELAFYLEEVLSLSNTGGANTGEVLRAATQVVPGDFDSVYNAFYYFAEEIHAIADNITNDPISTRDAYFRAATYYRAADFFDKQNQTNPRIFSLWDQQLASFNKAIALLEPAGERFVVKSFTNSSNIGHYEIPAAFYKASADHASCRDILARGLNCVTYEGPGQPTPRRNQNIGFIPDWWTSVSPVIDYLSTRQDVDMSKLALVGISFGGVLAPLAASHDHRISAVVALDGLVSLTDAALGTFPASIANLFNSHDEAGFDKLLLSISNNASAPSTFRWGIQQGLWSFNTKSPYDWFTRMSEIRLNKTEVAMLPMPIFVTSNDHDTLTHTQADIAYQTLTHDRPNGEALTYFHEYTSNLGGGEHVTIGAEAQLWQVIMEWLAGVWNEPYSNNWGNY